MYIDSVLPGTDAVIVPALLDFYGASPPILDATFGKGRFWFKQRPSGLIGIDLERGWADLHADNRHLPFRDETFRAIVYDPPHLIRAVASGATASVREPAKQSVMWKYNLASWDGNFKPFLAEAFRVLQSGGFVLAKLADALTKWPWNHMQFFYDARDAGFIPWDLVVKFRHPSIRNPSQRQLRSRRRHCFYCIVRKGKP